MRGDARTPIDGVLLDEYTARMSTECACPECQRLCQHEPGWFLPEEIEPAARFLQCTPEQFTRDYLTFHELDGASVLAPRTKPGTTTCIFFAKGKCQIHPVKPHECRKVFGCEAPRRHKRMRELIARQWR